VFTPESCTFFDKTSWLESWITMLLAAACRMPCRKGIGVWEMFIAVEKSLTWLPGPSWCSVRLACHWVALRDISPGPGCFLGHLIVFGFLPFFYPMHDEVCF
jgi:hypothetical protein